MVATVLEASAGRMRRLWSAVASEARHRDTALGPHSFPGYESCYVTPIVRGFGVVISRHRHVGQRQHGSAGGALFDHATDLGRGGVGGLCAGRLDGLPVLEEDLVGAARSVVGVTLPGVGTAYWVVETWSG